MKETRPKVSPSAGKPNDARALRLALATAVAERRVPDDVVSDVAKRLSQGKYQIRGIDVCPYGICLDYFFGPDDWSRALPELVNGGEGLIRSIEVFPWGIPGPDLFRVRVQQEVPQFAGARG